MSTLDVLAGMTEAQPIVVTVPAKEVVEPVNTPGQSDGIEVIPYNACLDPQADTFLPWLWKRMQEDDLVDYYFPGQRDTGFATFVRLFSGGAQVAIIKAVTDSIRWEDIIAGFTTWTPMRMGTSEVLVAGFIFFKKFWGHALTDAAAKAGFERWFTQQDTNVILGVCPSLHTLAIRYNKRIGLHEIGRIPMAHIYKGTPCDAILFAMTREEWEKRRA